MASQMMYHTHDYEWNPKTTNKRLRDKNINGIEKQKENRMRKLMVVGEKCHATWRVVLLQDECVDHSLRAYTICVEFIYFIQIQLVKYNG